MQDVSTVGEFQCDQSLCGLFTRSPHRPAREASARYCREVKGAVTRRLFTAQEGADMHSHVGNLSLSNAVVYDWLTEVFR
jgi:hypothetical protein